MPPDWPDPPLLSRLLFESPWPLVLALLAAAVALFLAGGRQGRPGIQKAALIPLLLALTLPAVARLVVTEREQLRDATRRLGDSVTPPVDLGALRELTAEDARLLHFDRGQLLNAARNASERYGVEGYRITDLRAFHEGGRYGQTYAAVSVRLSGARFGRDGVARTQWLLHWRRDDDGPWRLTAIDRVFVFDQDAEALIRGIVH